MLIHIHRKAIKPLVSSESAAIGGMENCFSASMVQKHKMEQNTATENVALTSCFTGEV